MSPVFSVEASAGTGKTYRIAEMYTRYIVGEGLPVDRVAVVTFTEAAKHELRRRLRDRLAEALRETGARAAARALADFDRAPIGTIHGFAAAALSAGTLLMDPPLRGRPGPGEAAIDDAAVDWWRRRLPQLPRLVVDRLLALDLVPGLAAELLQRAAAFVDGPAESGSPQAVAEAAAALEAAEAALRRFTADSAREAFDVAAAAYERGDLHKSRAKVFAPGEHPAELRQAWTNGLDAARDACIDGRLAASKLVAFTKKTRSAPVHPVFDAAEGLERAQRALDAAVDGAVAAEAGVMCRELPPMVDALRRRAGVLAFDDLILGAVRAVEAPAPAGPMMVQALRERFAVVMIDEFQDTDPAQWRMFRRVFGESPTHKLAVIGDPKQSIYAFRGADVAAYVDAVRDADARDTLDCNYRSDASAVTAVNRLFARARVLGEGISFAPVRAEHPDRLFDPEGRARSGLEIRFAESDSPRGASVRDVQLLGAEAVESLLADGLTVEENGGHRPLTPGDIAVLTYKRRDGVAVAELVRQAGIPVRLDGDEHVLVTPEGQGLFAVLDAWAAPGDRRRLRTALASPWVGLSNDELAAWADDDTGEVLQAWAERLGRWGAVARAGDVPAALYALVARCQTRARAAAGANGERSVLNIDHLLELVGRTAGEAGAGLARMISALQRSAAEPPEKDRTAVRPLPGADAVRVLTVHTSKGLEFPVVVFVRPYRSAGGAAAQRVVVYRDRGARRVALKGLNTDESRAAAAAAAADEEAEQARLLYVAMTRARHLTVVVTAAAGDVKKSPFGRLLLANPPDDDDDLVAAAADVLGQGAEVLDVDPQDDDEPVVPLRVPPPSAPRSGESMLRVRTFGRPAPRSVWGEVGYTTLAHDDTNRVDLRDADEVTREPAAEPPPGDGDVPAAVLPLADAPAGAAFGVFAHAVFELLPAGDAETVRDAVPAVVTRAARSWGFDPSAPWVPSFEQAVRAALTTPLDTHGATIAGTAPGDMLRELRFHLPLGRPLERRDEPGVTLARIAEVLDDGDPTWVPPGTLDALKAASNRSWAGYLTGAIDLVVRAGGRVHIVDYKTNRLGRTAADYVRQALERALVAELYPLQAHLYAVAVHRMLARGGGGTLDRVVYVFLRGLAAGEGVYGASMPATRIRALSALFDQ